MPPDLHVPQWLGGPLLEAPSKLSPYYYGLLVALHLALCHVLWGCLALLSFTAAVGKSWVDDQPWTVVA